MDKTLLQKELNRLGTHVTPYIFDILKSTNSTAKEMAKKGESEFSLVIAERQTAGRGRMGRSFFSSEDNGIYMSLILRPKLNGDGVFYITPLVAVSIAKALIEYGLDIKIKWVNDIFYKGRKVCGILTESSFDSHGITDWIVIGIGVNITKPKNDFPKDISNIAGALFEDGNFVKKEVLIAKIISSVICEYQKLPKKDFIEEYRRLSFLTGKYVTLPSGETVKVVGISENCGLTVEHSDKSIETLISSDVSIKIT